MNSSSANHLISGALLFGYISAAVFFFRFWTRTHDRLFAFFGWAFVILAGQRVLIAIASEATEDLTHLYVARLLAFLLILYAIVDKNRAATRG